MQFGKMTVIMPTFRRPEMLALSLENLQATPEASSLDVRIYLDHCVQPTRLEEVEYVRDEYFPAATIFHAGNHVLAPSGSWNILHSLKSGYETGAEYIALVEEDVLVRPDFFQRHLEMQASGDFFVTCGRQLAHLPTDYFSNPGSCYGREKLALVVPHICPAYFASQKDYLNQKFGSMDDAGILDDGLIRRVMRSVNGESRCAIPAIASHIGFHYYNRMTQYKNEGSIQDRIARLRVMLPNVSPADRYTGDFELF
jgi:hypothetical protein